MSNNDTAHCDAQGCSDDATREIVISDAFSDDNATTRCDEHAEILRSMADPENGGYGKPHDVAIVSDEPLSS
jgi:hypothetical protein